MIQEYRKKSAEMLGIQLTKYGIILGSQRPIKGLKSIIQLWHPESDADQMLMVWEWLNTEINLTIEWLPLSRKWNICLYAKRDNYAYPDGTDTDIKLATMKAFMRYIKITK